MPNAARTSLGTTVWLLAPGRDVTNRLSPARPSGMVGIPDRAMAMSRSKAGSSSQLLLQHLVDQRGVGLALGRFHDLADEPAEDFGVVLELFDLIGVGGDDLGRDLLDRAGIRDLLQALLLDDRRGVLTGLEHLGKDVLGDPAGDRAVLDQVDQLAELLGG